MSYRMRQPPIVRTVTDNSPDSRRAFTLVELLTVMAIVLILAALASVMLGKMRERGERGRVTNDLRQIGAALHAHASDNNGLFPTAGATIPYDQVDPDTGLPSWQEQLDPYTGNDRKIFGGAKREVLPSGELRARYFFGSAAAYESGPPGSSAFQPLRLARIEKPGRYILAGQISEHPFQADDADCDNYTQDPAFGHLGSSDDSVQLLFADGHIAAFKAFDPERMMTTYYEEDEN